MPNDFVLKGMKSADARVRCAAMLVAGENRVDALDLLLDGLLDGQMVVRQAARRSLIMLSADELSPGWRRKGRPDFVDFGPTPQSTRTEAKADQAMWRAWWIEKTK